MVASRCTLRCKLAIVTFAPWAFILCNLDVHWQPLIFPEKVTIPQTSSDTTNRTLGTFKYRYL